MAVTPQEFTDRVRGSFPEPVKKKEPSLRSFLDIQVIQNKGTSGTRHACRRRDLSYPAMLRRLEACCSRSALCVCPEGHEHKTYVKCYSRLCRQLPCQNARRYRIEKRYVAAVRKFKNPRFLTLTFQGFRPLTEAKPELDRAFKVFSQLMRRHQLVTAYVKALEVEPRGDGLYYCHFHIIFDGKYLMFEPLQAAWKRITGGSFMVHIRQVRNRCHAVSYVTKYISKGFLLDMSLHDYHDSLYMKQFTASWNCDFSDIPRFVCPEDGESFRYAGEVAGSLSPILYGRFTQKDLRPPDHL